MAKIPDIPSTEETGQGLTWLKKWLDTVRLWTQIRDPNATQVGDSLDKFVTRGELVQRGVLQRKSDGSYEVGESIGGTVNTTITNVYPTVGGYIPDLTPPPTPTGLAVTAGLTQILIEWDPPTYTQGQGNGQTNIYGAVWVDPLTDPEPVFADAQLINIAGKGGIFWTHPAALGTTWCIWIKWQSVDGVESTSPAGGANGEQATTGKIGNTDLNPLIITADKLSQGTYPNINLVPNGSAEDGLAGWEVIAFVGPSTFTTDATTKVSGSRSFKLTRGGGGGDFVGASCLAFPVIPGETYSVKVRIRGSSASTNGAYVQIYERSASPASGFIRNSGPDVYDSFQNLYVNSALTTGWVTLEFTYTATAGRYWASLAVVNYFDSTSTDMWFDDAQVGRQITASFLAANAIAVGSAAIQDGAIRNAMLGNASVDDLKVANVSAAKLTTGTLAVGQSINGGAFTGWAWPVSGTGFHISNNGILLGNAITGPGYFQITAAGDVYAPNFSIVGGVASLAAVAITGNALVANSGTWAVAGGAMSGTTWDSGLVGTFTLATTGSRVKVHGSIKFDGILSGATAVYASIDLSLWIDGVQQTPAFGGLRTVRPVAGPGRYFDDTVTLFWNGTLSAATHTFQVRAFVSWYDVNGNPFSLSFGTVNVLGRVMAEENKV